MTLDEAKEKIRQQMWDYRRKADQSFCNEGVTYRGAAGGLYDALTILDNVEPVSKPLKHYHWKLGYPNDPIDRYYDYVTYGHENGFPSSCTWIVPGTLDPVLA